MANKRLGQLTAILGFLALSLQFNGAHLQKQESAAVFNATTSRPFVQRGFTRQSVQRANRVGVKVLNYGLTLNIYHLL